MNEQINYNYLRALTNNNQDYQQTQDKKDVYSNSTTLSQPSADTTEFSSPKATKTRNWILAGLGATALAIIFRKNISKFADDIFKGAKNADDAGKNLSKGTQDASNKADDFIVSIEGSLDDATKKALDTHNKYLKDLKTAGLSNEQLKNINQSISGEIAGKGAFEGVWKNNLLNEQDYKIIKHLSENDDAFKKSLTDKNTYILGLDLGEIQEFTRAGGKFDDTICLNKIIKKNNPKRPKRKPANAPNLEVTPAYKKVTDELANFTDKKAILPRNKGTSRESALKDLANRYRNSEIEPQTAYNTFINTHYDNIRVTNRYSMKETLTTSNIEDITAKNTSKIDVSPENGWHYRKPKNRKANGWGTGDKSIDRISLNVKADENLIKELDDLIYSGEMKVIYKTPAMNEDWIYRHDPITMYFYKDKATPQNIEAIKKVASKYIRTTDDVLIGQKIAPGIALDKSPTTADMKKLIKEASDIDEDLGQTVDRYFKHRTDKTRYKSSSGQVEAVKRTIKYLKAD